MPVMTDAKVKPRGLMHGLPEVALMPHREDNLQYLNFLEALREKDVKDAENGLPLLIGHAEFDREALAPISERDAVFAMVSRNFPPNSILRFHYSPGAKECYMLTNLPDHSRKVVCVKLEDAL